MILSQLGLDRDITLGGRERCEKALLADALDSNECTFT